MLRSFDCPVDESASLSCVATRSPRAALAVDQSIRLRNLWLPFAVRLTASRGEHLLASAGRCGVLREGASINVPAWRSFNYDSATILDPRVGRELHLSIRRDILEAPGLGVTLSNRLAQAVFDKPALDWSLRFAAERVALTECKFKAELFREGKALTTTVREQRLMRGLLELMGRSRTWNDLEHLATRLGFGNVARFEAAFLAQFGCSATHIARLAWYPPLTWSVSSPFSSIDN